MIEHMWSIFEFIVVIFESLIIMTFSFSAIKTNLKHPRNILIVIVSSMGLSIVILLLSTYTDFEGLWGILLYSIYVFIVLSVFSKEKYFRNLVVAAIPVLSALAINSFVSFFVIELTNSNVDSTYEHGDFDRIVIILIAQSLRLYILSLVLQIFKKDELSLSKRDWLLLIMTFIISFTLFLCIHLVQLEEVLKPFDNFLLFISKLGLIILDTVIFNIIISLSKKNKIELENSILKKVIDNQKDRVDDIKKQYAEIKQIRHDMKQTLIVINNLAKKRNYENLIEYLESYSISKQDNVFTIDTNNDYVNAILNDKLTIAKSKLINILCSAPKNIDGVDDVDLCVLLGNLLDNAIEACELCTVDKKYIEVNIFTKDTELEIIVKNSVSISPMENNSLLKTSKPDPVNHGYGMKSIKNIADSYGGYVDYYEDESLFCVQVCLNKISSPILI